MAASLSLFKKRNNAGIQNWLIAITLMILLSLSFDGETLWIVMMKLLPGAGSLRASSRVAMMIVLFSAPCIALAAENWDLTLKLYWGTTCEILALSASFLSIWAIPEKQHQFQFDVWENELNSVSSKLNDSDCDVFWYQWRDQPPFRAHVLAMHAQSRSNIPTANGYSGQFPSNDWPFSIQSGRNAFKWLSSELSKTKLNSRKAKEYTNKCIIYLDRRGAARINKYDLNAPKKTYHTIAENTKLAIAEDENQYLNFRMKKLEPKNEWKLILRRGKPIPSYRGNGKFEITSVNFTNNTLFIKDVNKETNESYIWEINPKSGVFIKGAKITKSQNDKDKKKANPY